VAVAVHVVVRVLAAVVGRLEMQLVDLQIHMPAVQVADLTGVVMAVMATMAVVALI
jgi:hypothetical protein